jgi:taurine dioxygenase
LVEFRVNKLGAALGAEIVGLDARRHLDADTVAALRAAWLEHLVLAIRGEPLSDDQLVDFSLQFGELDGDGKPGPYTSPDNPRVLVVSNVVKDGRPTGVLGDNEAKWHVDRSHVATPPSTSILHALEIPAEGGDTYFMNMYEALAHLPQDLVAEIESRALKHDSSYGSDGNLRLGREEVTDVSAAPGYVHPMIRRHPESGRRALYLGRRLNAWVTGMAVDESEALLNRIWAYIEGDESLVYRHRWSVGDIVMWDNRCVMHKRDAFDSTARRVMHRTELKGGPVEAALA